MYPKLARSDSESSSNSRSISRASNENGANPPSPQRGSNHPLAAQSRNIKPAWRNPPFSWSAQEHQHESSGDAQPVVREAQEVKDWRRCELPTQPLKPSERTQLQHLNLPGVIWPLILIESCETEEKGWDKIGQQRYEKEENFGGRQERSSHFAK